MSKIWLGIDPGIARTGFGVIRDIGKGVVEVIDYGCITTQSRDPLAKRLNILHEELTQIIKLHNPSAMAVEKIFFSKNAKTAITVGHARGVVMLCAEANGMELHEFTPLQIKQGLTGYGRADKNQIQQMVKSILGLKTVPKPDDTADALAVALLAINSKKNVYESK